MEEHKTDPRDGLPPEPGYVRIDWKEYYERFKLEHGRDPVPHKGRRLFMDGWMYAGKDDGQEFPPPTEPLELCKLQLTYWRVRKYLVSNEMQQLRSLVDNVRNLQSTRSMPLLQSVFALDEEQGRRVLRTVELDTKKLQDDRLRWLEDDVDECDLKIAEYKGVYGELIGEAIPEDAK